jgi:hypothetical protein
MDAMRSLALLAFMLDRISVTPIFDALQQGMFHSLQMLSIWCSIEINGGSLCPLHLERKYCTLEMGNVWKYFYTKSYDLPSKNSDAANCGKVLPEPVGTHRATVSPLSIREIVSACQGCKVLGTAKFGAISRAHFWTISVLVFISEKNIYLIHAWVVPQYDLTISFPSSKQMQNSHD